MGDVYVTKGGADDREHTPLGVLRYFLGAPGPSGFGSRSTAMQVAAKWDGHGRVAIVTGSSGGLGAETAAALAAAGATVVLAARDAAKTARVAEAIARAHPGAPEPAPMHLDLSSLALVRAFAADFQKRFDRLDILICNAGTVFAPLSLSKDGHESAFATNHLGHWLLVELLRPLLAKTARDAGGGARGRVVLLSSEAHRHPYPAALGGPVRFERLNDAEGYSVLASYAQSKLCNLLHARELQRRADAAGEPLAAAAVHPGVIATDADRHVPLPRAAKLLLRLLLRPLIKSAPQGAATAVYAATAPGLPGGEYLADCNLCASSAASHDARLGRRLWEFSERLAGAPAGGR